MVEGKVFDVKVFFQCRAFPIFAGQIKKRTMRNIFILFVLISNLVVAQQKEMTLEDAILGAYSSLRPETMNGLSWKNETTFTFVKNDTLRASTVKKSGPLPVICLDGLNAIIKPGNDFRRFPSYSWLKNELLLVQAQNSFYVLNLNENKLEYKIELPGNAENAVFCETGKFAAFTKNDDLFASFYDGRTVQITSDGGNGIVNGKTVHRSEFGITNGIFNSPNGNYIAFYRKDETMVRDYPLVDFMAREAEYTPVKYPMAGMTSHHVTVGIYGIQSEKTTFLQTGEPLDHFLTNIAWSPNEETIYLKELNREQNHMQLNAYEAASGKKIKTLFEERSETYVEPLYPIRFSERDENEFYELSRKDGWFHLYKYNTKGELLQQITKGEWEVTNILGFDEKEKTVFVEATKDSPVENHVYSVDIKSGDMKKLTLGEGVHHGVLSPGSAYVLDNWRGPSLPNVVDLLSTKGSIVRNLHSAANPLVSFNLGNNSLVTLKTADGKNDLYGRIIKPANFDPSKKYPVVVYVYGGPHSQMVNKSWNYGAQWWQYYMAAQGYVAFTLDGRGTNMRGRDFETAIHRQLGILETEDQMQGIEYLKSLPFVDAGRIGVHGWSYGGFMTLNLMLRHPETFKVGVAGGPVVDWAMYEIMYGERYMDTPQENPEGFAETNMENHVAKLNGKLMLIHGVQDETVVMQHSMKFLRECVKQNKQVDFFAYPTHPHNVRGKDRLHLMEKVSRYFMENL